MHFYENKSFSPEQELLLRNSAGPSTYIKDFLTDKEFSLCRKIVMNTQDWPEHGQVSKYWGFGWDSGPGPLLKWLEEKVNKILPNWKLDFLAIQEGINPWKIHADIRWYADQIPYKVLLLPMDVEPTTGSVDIDNWPDTYTIAFNQRNFLNNYNSKEVSQIGSYGNNQSNWIRPYEDPKIEGLVSGYHINQNLWQQYFSHIPYEHLEGLTIDQIHKWQPKSLFYWDNTSLHCADNFLAKNIKTKRSLMLFTLLGDE
jgi:hypothetical protein